MKPEDIKFRGKRRDTGEWVVGSYYRYIEPVANGIIKTFILPPPILHKPDIEQILRFEVDPSTVGQYTGLKDKNGKEIFKGDILISPEGREFMVVWIDNSWKI